jgi:uncharacterized membrane protein YhaH (DUF805 family)
VKREKKMTSPNNQQFNNQQFNTPPQQPQYQPPQQFQQPQQPMMPPMMPPMNAGPQLPQGNRGIDQPWYGIGFGDALSRFFAKFTRVDGRASRGEFWWAFLGVVIVGAVLNIIGAVGGIVAVVLEILAYLVELTLIPVAIRRVHDTNKPGGWAALLPIFVVLSVIGLYLPWWLFPLAIILMLLSLAAAIWFIVLMATKTYMAPTMWDIPLQPMPAQPAPTMATPSMPSQPMPSPPVQQPTPNQFQPQPAPMPEPQPMQPQPAPMPEPQPMPETAPQSESPEQPAQPFGQSQSPDISQPFGGQ